MLANIKGAWHEYFEKLILLKLADKVSVHLNISSTMRKMQSCLSFRSNRRKLCLCYLLFYLVWWPCFLISKQHFCWFLLKYLEHPHQVRKIWLNVWYQNHIGFEKNLGMMLWIMSGTFNLWRLRTLHSPVVWTVTI